MNEKSQKKLIIHAPNVHTGGGKVLLVSLLNALSLQGVEAILIADTRFSYPLEDLPHIKIYPFKPTLWGRFLAECRLKKAAREGDVILCFGSLPPLFKVKGTVSLFLQNCHLLKSPPLNAFGIKTNLRIYFEKKYLRFFLKHASTIYVQTQSMKQSVAKNLSSKKNLVVFPFYPIDDSYIRTASLMGDEMHVEYHFLYIASGEAHKNHKNLLLAWEILAEEALYPKLSLTLDKQRDKDAYAFMKKVQENSNLRIQNFGAVTHGSAKALYQQVHALIFPSFCESFGLPLIEAKQFGVHVVASELDYVRDVLDPVETFDPNSARSIAKAVSRYIGKASKRDKVLEASDFINHLLSSKEHDGTITRNLN